MNMRPPDFLVINKELRKMTGKTKKNFGEILMAHYESYLQNLDRQVRQREQEYKRQKFLADQVNSRLLPPGVVEQLKNLGRNEKFDAKSYDEVSLYFSDIVGFTTIGKQSTPQQIMIRAAHSARISSAARRKPKLPEYPNRPQKPESARRRVGYTVFGWILNYAKLIREAKKREAKIRVRKKFVFIRGEASLRGILAIC